MNPRTIAKKVIPKSAFRKVEPIGHLGEAVLLNTLKGGSPAKRMKVIGVTGTNGKTTTCFLIHRMLYEAGFKVGLMTTVGYGVGDDIKPQVEHMTTLPAGKMIKRLKELEEQGAEWLVMEITSHALAQHRVWGVPFHLAVMTNVSEEHLDYHGTFARYRDAKRRLFKLANANKKGLRAGIINADDPSAELFAEDIAHPLTYGVDKGELKAKELKLSASGSVFKAEIGKDSYEITCRLPGSFNVYNALAAIGAGRAIGLTRQQVEKGIANLLSVEGRMVNIDEGQDFEVIVDYAHTPDSFEKLFKDIKPLAKGRLITVFGSAGRRDEKKRAVQGALAGKYADLVFITEEDDRDIDGIEIMEQIASGAEKAGKARGKDLFLIHKREEAIEAALKQAKKGDVVMLLGKGHEKGILSPGPKAAELRHLQQDDNDPRRVIDRPYNEVEAARKALKTLKKPRG